MRISLKGESRREEQLPEERPQVQSQVRGRPKVRVADAVAAGRGAGSDASSGGSVDRASRAADPESQNELKSRHCQMESWTPCSCLSSAVPTCSSKSLREYTLRVRVRCSDRHVAQIVGTALAAANRGKPLSGDRRSKRILRNGSAMKSPPAAPGDIEKHEHDTGHKKSHQRGIKITLHTEP